MEHDFEAPPTCAALFGNNVLAVGLIDGSLSLYLIQADLSLKLRWKFQMKSSVRAVAFSHSGAELFCICRNRAVCSYDTRTGVRTRCLVTGTKGRPNAICLLPETSRKGQQFAVGDENGEIRTFNFRSQKPIVSTWNEQHQDVNALAVDSKHNLLSASADGTVAAYEVRKCKLRTKSEVMHSELLSLCVTDKYVYAGGIDSHIEVFSHGEYGNLLERIETKFEDGVSSIVELRKGLLLIASQGSSKLHLLNVMPTKRLGAVAKHGDEDSGVDQLLVSEDKTRLISLAGMAMSIKIWDLPALLAEIPILRAAGMKKQKTMVAEGFFDGLKTKAAEESDEDEEDEDEMDEEAEDEEDDSEEDFVKRNHPLFDNEAEEDSDDDVNDNGDEEEEEDGGEDIDEEDEEDEEEEDEEPPKKKSKVMISNAKKTIRPRLDFSDDSDDEEEEEESD